MPLTASDGHLGAPSGAHLQKDNKEFIMAAKKLYRFEPFRKDRTIKLGRKTYLKDGQCVYLTDLEAAMLPDLIETDPETGYPVDYEEQVPEAVVVVEIPEPKPVSNDEIKVAEKTLPDEGPSHEVLDMPKPAKPSRRRARKAKKA